MGARQAEPQPASRRRRLLIVRQFTLAASARSGSRPLCQRSACRQAFFATALIAAKPVKPCDGAVFRVFYLLSKTERNARVAGRARIALSRDIRLWIAAWATHGANSSRQQRKPTRPQRACAGRFSFAPDSKAGHRQGRPRSAQPIPSPKPSLKPNRFFGGLLIRSGWRKEPRCCSHFSAGLRSVFAAAAPRKSPFFCSFFDSDQARQTVRWSRFRGLGFAPENEAEWGWLVNPFFARGRNRAASVPLNRIARP